MTYDAGFGVDGLDVLLPSWFNLDDEFTRDIGSDLKGVSVFLNGIIVMFVENWFSFEKMVIQIFFLLLVVCNDFLVNSVPIKCESLR